jgi:hypothetical protein
LHTKPEAKKQGRWQRDYGVEEKCENLSFEKKSIE